MKTYIEKCLAGEHLSVDEASGALSMIMTGQATDSQIAGLLIALRAKGETVDELVGFARTMREHAVHVHIDDPDAIDMCGTGGDGLRTFNISTVSSFVVAGAGVTVAKHGNRSVSSQSGSADVLMALGVNIQCPPETVQACINRIGIGFFFAPLFHPAMKFAAKPRTELGVRSIFNMVGPLTNPAGVKRQLIGVYQLRITSLLAGAL
ncbi:MAG: anthranilate phosphoribosyltransferase, partial [Methanobacteriota archaeon]